MVKIRNSLLFISIVLGLTTVSCWSSQEDKAQTYHDNIASQDRSYSAKSPDEQKMIRATFIFLDGIGEKTEKRLWSIGIHSWGDFLSSDSIKGISRKRKALYDQKLREAVFRLKNKDWKYFRKRVEKRDHWRFFEALNKYKKVLFLDIETTGLSMDRDDITVVGFYNGTKMKALIKGIDLTEENLKKELHGYEMLVTFNGRKFDLPFIRRKFRRLDLNLFQFDLCLDGKKVGLKGGLKSIERELAIRRDEQVIDINGKEAPLLWERYQKGEKKALDLLLKYNEEDTKNLSQLAQIIYTRLLVNKSGL